MNTKWLWLPCVVVLSKTTIDYKIHSEQYEVRDSTVTIYDQIVGKYDTVGICDDMAEALNEAHSRRTEPITTTIFRDSEGNPLPYGKKGIIVP